MSLEEYSISFCFAKREGFTGARVAVCLLAVGAGLGWKNAQKQKEPGQRRPAEGRGRRWRPQNNV